MFPNYNLRHRGSRYFKATGLIALTAIPRLYSGVESIEDTYVNGILIQFKPNAVNKDKDLVAHALSNYCYRTFDYRNVKYDV